jgi:hypothetical protein
MKYYELHITMDTVRRDLAEEIVKAIGWKYSCIDGDPVLGKGSKVYATKHFNQKKSEEEVMKELNKAELELAHYYLNPIRKKIELVLFDSKNMVDV